MKSKIFYKWYILVLLSILIFYIGGCCPPFCKPDPPRPDDRKSMLSPPTVIPPLYECATAVSVEGFVPGATIDIYANGARMGGGVSDAPWGQSFSVPALVAGQLVTATQTVSGITSLPSKAVEVVSFFKTHPEGLPKPALETPLYECGGAIGVRNLAQGGLLEVFADGNLVGNVNGCGAGQWLFVNPSFVKNQGVYAAETLCLIRGPQSDLETVQAAPASLPTPTVRDVYEGGKYATVDNIVNGAMTKVYNGVLQIAGHYCSGGSQIFRLNPQPAAGDSLTADQQLCNVKSNPSDPTTVKPCRELPAPTIPSICAGDDSITVSGAVPDARIRVYANGNLIGDGGGTTINLTRPVVGGESITVTQSLGQCTSPPSTPVQVGQGSKVACSIPPYSPAYWNDGGFVELNNNCYNYGNNKRTDTFAQPGRAAGATWWHCKDANRRDPACATCKDVYNAAIADGLKPLPASGICPCNKDKLALVIAPGWDYHWYRLDSGGMWSHKPGGTPATDHDNSGNPVANPETADRGEYTDFCGYFCSCSDAAQGQGHENIN